ncbi:MAG: amylo-alpha-1,6-glucosidase [Candidatus Baltobacteraceae bacterium]
MSGVDLARDVCGDLVSAQRREWLVTNGLGGYACGTVAGLPTRRYHGLLIAATHPPTGRRVLVTKFDETVTYAERVYELGANRWADGTLAPEGFRYLERFRLDGSIPVWTYAIGDAQIEKRVWMEHGENATYVSYSVVRASRNVEMRVKAFVDFRSHHALTKADSWRMDIDRIPEGLRVTPTPEAEPFFVLSNAPIVRDTHDWYHGLRLECESERGLDDITDHLHAGNFTTDLGTSDTLAFLLTNGERRSLNVAEALERRKRRDAQLVADWERATGPANRSASASVRQLVLAADQFVVERVKAETRVPTVIAGYPWFADWGRDTMLSLPGLLLRTGRPQLAAGVLRAFAQFVDGGMLPNAFPDDGGEVSYNTVDGALLFIDAVYRYHRATGDRALVGELFPTLAAIVRAYNEGTRFGIGVDPADGLVHAGAPDVALTWMDARVGETVVTPRIGKPIEINALWYHGLVALAQLAGLLGTSASPYVKLAAKAKTGFARYWDPSERFCFDVLDGPHGADLSLRPNQLFAVALEHRPLAPEQERAIVAACAGELLTPAGLRTLAAGAPDYRPRYRGSVYERDGAYHQGTVWPWLIGPFAAAARNVGYAEATVASFVDSVARQLTAYGLGTVAEIANAEPPFALDGCFAQAWSVAAVLDSWSNFGS